MEFVGDFKMVDFLKHCSKKNNDDNNDNFDNSWINKLFILSYS
jgi:hypothetical protein